MSHSSFPLPTPPPVRLDALTREGLIESFSAATALNDWLFSGISDDAAYYCSPDPLRNPLIFYLGHTSAFYMQKLRTAGLMSHPVDEHIERLFARGVDPATPEELRGAAAWPTVARTRAFRAEVTERVLEVLGRIEIRPPVTDRDPLWAVLMGIEHARIHFETSSVLIRQAPLSVLTRPTGWSPAPTFGAPAEQRRLRFAAGEVRLGKPANTPWFGWDNEYGELTRQVPAFDVGQRLVTCSDFLPFVLEGGYRNPTYWTDEARAWIERYGVTQPRFWVMREGQFMLRTVFGERELPLDWPVEVCAHEALAWCRWRGDGARLPSEAECARMGADAPTRNDDVIEDPHYNLNLRWCSPSPVGAMGATPSGVQDAYGNVWQWLSDDFYALPNFRPHALYDDFSLPYMDADHSMMLGGSWASTGATASRFYRLWFRRHFYQHAGFRPAWSAS